MTNEEAIKRAVRQKTAIEDLIRAKTTSSVVRATYSDELEFINAVLKALRRRKRSETAKRIPLTIPQLCNMYGERVRLADLDAETEKTVTLGRCGFVTQDGDIPCVVGVYYSTDEEKNCFASFKYYKRSWLAYAYPPAHIDREAWEPCSLCGEYEVFLFDAWHDKNMVTKFPDCKGASLFCPWCGRPLTEGAWTELEKRIGGAAMPEPPEARG